MRKKRSHERPKIDAKERSKERKKTVEENRGKVDKKAAAMNLLKAKRQEKIDRGKFTFQSGRKKERYLPCLVVRLIEA
jgi:hypothetical protein